MAREEGDELTALEMAKLMDMQLQSCNEFDDLLAKAKAYDPMPSLYYHLDTQI